VKIEGLDSIHLSRNNFMLLANQIKENLALTSHLQKI
jgi:hypothetical protein